MKEVYRDPLSISLGVAMPAAMLVLFVTIGKNTALDIFTPIALAPAVAVFSFAFLTMFSAVLLTRDRQTAFLTRLLTTPLRPREFILAYTIPFLPAALLQIVACFAVAAVFGINLDLSIAASLIVLVPAAITCIGLGMLVGSLCTENQVAGIGSVVIVVASLFGGAWMNLREIGGVFEAIGYALPFAHAIDATRAIIKGARLSDVRSDLYWLFAYTVAFYTLGVFSFAWRTKR